MTLCSLMSEFLSAGCLKGTGAQVPGPAATFFQQDYLSLRDSLNSEISVLGVPCKWCELGNYYLKPGG